MQQAYSSTIEVSASSLQARLLENDSAIVMDYTINNAAAVSFTLMSAAGRVLQRNYAGNRNTGFHSDHFTITDGVVPGIYIVEMNAGKNGSFVRTVVVK